MKQQTVDLIVNETVDSSPDMLRQDTVDGTVTIGHSRQDSQLHYDTVDVTRQTQQT